jgi:nitrogen fixation-related uncharacterized protein
MTYTPLAAILAVLVIGGAVSLMILFYASQHGYFRNLKSGAYVIFDDDEPVGHPQDQLFRDSEDEDATSSPTPPTN